jgi:hypothetical protein
MRPLLTILLLAFGPYALAAVEIRGRTDSGAYYIAQAPDGWRAGDALVLINHGFDIDEPDPEPSLGPIPLRQRMLSQGYAIAASSYSQRGWALFATPRDHRELVAAFAQRFGLPGRLLASGGSMGGLVALQQAEQGDLGAPVAGVYSVCAPLAGARVWHQALDLRLSYDAVCRDVSGGELPRGDDALPYILKAEELDDYDSISGGGELALRIARCTGYGLSNILQTSNMRERYQRLRNATGVDDRFFLENMFYATYGLSEMVRNSAKLGERVAISSANVVYPEAAVQANVRRVSADPFAALDLWRAFTPTGQGVGAKVLTTHTTRDGLVVPANARALEGKLASDRWSQAFVVEGSASHCGYSDAELLGGWMALTRWVDGGAKPDTASLQSSCQVERNANPGLGDCRYGAFEAPALTSALKPRNETRAPIDARLSGFWFDPARSGEGLVVEALPDGRAVVTFFTFPPPGSTDQQAWFTGLARSGDDGEIAVDAMVGRRGGRFGGDFDPASAQPVPLGRFDAVLTRCGGGEQRILAGAPFDNARRPLARLTRVGAATCPGETPAGFPNAQVGLSGAWYEESKPGRGLQLQIQDDGQAFLAWFSYAPNGAPIWLVGAGSATAGGAVFDTVTRPVGTRFGAAFVANDVRQTPWGRIAIEKIDCNRIVVDYDASEPGYGKARIAMTRLTSLRGASCQG